MSAQSIDAIEANKLLQQQKNIFEKTQNIIKRGLEDPVNAAFLQRFNDANVPWFKDFYDKVKAHFEDDKHAYVFTQDEVTKCFASGAKHLMILVASQYDSIGDAEKGKETAIIAGCAPVAGGFETVDKTPMGFEHPPKFYKVIVPTAPALIRKRISDLIEKLNDTDGIIDAAEIKSELSKLIEDKKEYDLPDKVEIVEQP